MALFKILRGLKDNLVTTKIKDGYAYFTPEDGRFYIDVSDTDGIDPIFGSSTSKGANRICINDGGFMDNLILDCGRAKREEEVVVSKIQLIFGDSSSAEDDADAIFDHGDSSLDDDLNTIIFDNGNSFFI